MPKYTPAQNMERSVQYAKDKYGLAEKVEYRSSDFDLGLDLRMRRYALDSALAHNRRDVVHVPMEAVIEDAVKIEEYLRGDNADL
jgi:hypothetical protein